MAALRRAAAGLAALVGRRRREQDLDDELQAYLEASIDDHMRRGLGRDEATRAARAAMGSLDAVKDHTRDAGWEAEIESAWRDARYAVRSLGRSPGFAAVVIATLALGIGANTAIFQLADAVRLRPLPVVHPEQLVEVRMVDPSRGRSGTFAGRRPTFTYALWDELRRRQQAFSGLVAWSAFPVNLAARGEARFAQGMWVSGGYFDVLGVRPYVGRLLGAEDDRPGCGSPGAVLGHAFWQRQYGADPSVVGRTVRLDGHPFEIVGVAPREFAGLEVGRTFDVAAPICAERILNREHGALGDRRWWWLTVIGRLAPGGSADRASSHLARLSPGVFREALAADLPPDVAQQYLASTLAAYPASTGVSGTVREEYETPVWVLLAAAGAVLLVAAANLAMLLVARATAREREIGVRLALGASRGRVVRQLFTENALLGVAGAAAGVLLAGVVGQGLLGLLQTHGFQFFAVTLTLEPSWRVVAFVVLVTAVTCAGFGFVPALLATRPSAGTLLATSSRTATSGPARAAAAGGLVLLQVALSLVLVVTALLFARTLRNLATLDGGFEPDRVTVVVVDYQHANVPAAGRLALQERLLGAVRSVAGVEAAASVRMVPLTGESWVQHVEVDGVRHQTQAYFNIVSAGFFRSMGTRVIAGRDFTTADGPGSRPVAIVNESFARRLLGAHSPMGRTFRLAGSAGASDRVFEVVGLVGDTKYTGLREPFEPIAYFAASQDEQPPEYVNLVVRASAPSLALTRSVTDAISRAQPESVTFATPLETQLADGLVRERLLATLSGGFGAVAVLLALLGVYGLVAYGVAQRTREIGIRTALGARPPEILALVLRQSTRLTIAGVIVGLAAAAAVTRSLGGLLFGLAPLDPATFAGVAIAFPLVAAAAALLPARRATKVDPLIALRSE